MKTSVLKIFSVTLLFLLLTGCVDQQSKKAKSIDGDHARIITTSAACADIMDKLDLDLVAIADSKLESPPARYANLPTIGMAMNPDMEKFHLSIRITFFRRRALCPIYSPSIERLAFISVS